MLPSNARQERSQIKREVAKRANEGIHKPGHRK